MSKLSWKAREKCTESWLFEPHHLKTTKQKGKRFQCLLHPNAEVFFLNHAYRCMECWEIYNGKFKPKDKPEKRSFPTSRTRPMRKQLVEMEEQKEKVKEWIVDFVVSKQGCKAMDLCVNIAELYGKFDFDIGLLVEELVKEKRLVEVEYILPSMSYRVKSFLLPKETEVKING